MTKVRLEWTLAEFYADGGVTRFVDRMAASLGISAHRIKTVAVYEGSVIIDFAIEADEEAEDADAAATELLVVQQNLVAGISDGSFDLGAEVLGLQTMEGEVLAGEYIPGADEVATTVDHSAIVGDKNLWDDLIVDRDGSIVIPSGDNDNDSNTETPSTSTEGSSTSSSTEDSSTTSSSGGTTVTTQSETEDFDIMEDNKTKARTQIVTVTVEETTEVTMEDETNS